MSSDTGGNTSSDHGQSVGIKAMEGNPHLSPDALVVNVPGEQSTHSALRSAVSDKLRLATRCIPPVTDQHKNTKDRVMSKGTHRIKQVRRRIFCFVPHLLAGMYIVACWGSRIPCDG